MNGNKTTNILLTVLSILVAFVGVQLWQSQQSLSEEMEFMGNIGNETIEAARKEIVDIILRLDQAGELILEA